MSNSDITKKSKKTAKRRIFLTTGIFLILILAALVFSLLQSEIKPDLASAKTIREIAAKQLNKEPSELTDEDFAKISEFNLREKIPAGIGPNGEHLFMYGLIELSDIRLLEKFVNLQKLNLNSIKCQNKSNVMKVLSKIGLTNLFQRKFIDLSPLMNLRNLQSLDLSQSEVSDIQAVSGLINLQELNIDNTEVSDLKPVERLTNLQNLSISNTMISDLKPLSNLTNLQRLWLPETEVSDIESIRNLTNLQWLHLQGTPISDLEPLKNLINLKQLWLKDCNKITDEQIEDLQKALPNLEIHK